MPPPAACDVFCRVVDNFGDAGVALRLSRQLASEHGLAVRLFVDDLASLARIVPGLDARASSQPLDGFSVHSLAHADASEPAPLVVEAFGCGLPERYLDAMEAAHPPPVWLNLEYLSAEPWVEKAHGLPSPHPTRALRRWFFFPGFTAATGGLLRERDLAQRRDAHRRDIRAQASLWRELGIATLPPDALTVSLFCYPNVATHALLDRWTREPQPVVCVVPEGVAADALAARFGPALRHPPVVLREGALTLVVAPFVDQQRFDARLWTCALNFVRGEDSFVRAHWAARPLVWHIYPQREDAHVAKLEAFLEGYTAGLAAAARSALHRFTLAWNAQDAGATDAAWAPLRAALPALARHASERAAQMEAQVDLATKLVSFARDRL